MIEKHNRSILKAISWRIFGSIDTVLVSLFITQNIKLALSIGLIETFTKMFLYYFHERLWNKTNFGKIPINEQKDPLYKSGGFLNFELALINSLSIPVLFQLPRKAL